MGVEFDGEHPWWDSAFDKHWLAPNPVQWDGRYLLGASLNVPGWSPGSEASWEITHGKRARRCPPGARAVKHDLPGGPDRFCTHRLGTGVTCQQMSTYLQDQAGLVAPPFVENMSQEKASNSSRSPVPSARRVCWSGRARSSAPFVGIPCRNRGDVDRAPDGILDRSPHPVPSWYH